MTNPEQVLIRVLLWASSGAAVAVPVLVLPQPEDPLLTVTIHLSLIVLFGMALAFHLAPLGDEPWFSGLDIGESTRTVLTWVVVAALVAAASGVAAVATAAALRYTASLQYLVLLSVLGIVMTLTLTVLGTRRGWGGSVALWSAMTVGVIGVWAIWRYLDSVGIGADGGWAVDGAAVMRLVVPFDLVRWAIAFTAVSIGRRRAI